jgi:2-polyprenyl-3-methyl-5-hydroxy-6-metoxy-1,4-benzoquinol methylase
MNGIQLPEVYLQKNCPLCGSNKSHPVKSEQNLFPAGMADEVRSFDGTWIQLMECRDCGFGFSKEIPSSKTFFASRYDIRFDPQVECNNFAKVFVHEQILRLLHKHGRMKGRALDIGSFGGVFLRFLNENGFEAEGIELNPTMADYTRKNLGLTVYQTSIHDHQPDKRYSMVSLIDVLEHLFLPMEILKKTHSLLEEGGHLLIKVPNYRLQVIKQFIANTLRISELGVFRNFGHINQFSPKSLSRALKKAGFEPLECQVARSEIVGGNTLSIKIRNAFRTLSFHLLETLRRISGIHFGPNLVMLARKR